MNGVSAPPPRRRTVRPSGSDSHGRAAAVAQGGFVTGAPDREAALLLSIIEDKELDPRNLPIPALRGTDFVSMASVPMLAPDSGLVGVLNVHTVARRAFTPGDVRLLAKGRRETAKRGYAEHDVLAELARRENESAEFIRPQRAAADIVVRFAPVPSRNDPPETPLSAELMLRPTVPHPDVAGSWSWWTAPRCT